MIKANMKHLIIGTLLLCSASSAMLAAPSSQAQQKMSIAKVDVFEVHPTKNIPMSFAYPARLESIQSATVVARVTGILLKKHFTEGTYVKKGSLLYTIEPDTYAALVKEREADYLVAKSVYINAKRDWSRAEGLYKDNALSKKEYDATLSVFESAAAEVKAAQARLETAKIDLGYTKVHAPISGIISQKEIDLGNLVTHGTSLVSITQTNPIYAEFSIPDTDILKIRQAMKTDHKTQQIDIDVLLNLGKVNVNGKVDYIAPIIDPKTSSVQARAVLKNTDNALMPGGFGRITFQGLHYSNVTLIPQKSVLQNPKGTIIFIVEDGKVAIRPVKLGDSIGENYLVEAPLRPGDKIIVNNFFRIKPGIPVAIDKTINAESE